MGFAATSYIFIKVASGVTGAPPLRLASQLAGLALICTTARSGRHVSAMVYHAAARGMHEAGFLLECGLAADCQNSKVSTL